MDPPAIYEHIIGNDDWHLVTPLDLYVSDATIGTQQDFEAADAAKQAQAAEAGGYFAHRVEFPRYPYIVMESRQYVWTSIHVALRKSGHSYRTC